MMKKALATSALAAILALGNSAAQAEEAEVSASLDLPVLSAYVWRGQVISEDAVIQPSLTVSKGGFSINWWANFNLTDDATGDDAEFSEHDISISYSSVCPLTGANMTIGVVNYDFPNVGLEDADGNLSLVNDTREVFLIAAFSDVLLSPTLSVYYDFKEADGFYGSLGVSHDVELTDKASLSLAASLGAADKDWGSFYYGEGTSSGLNDWSVSASIPFAVSDSLTVTPGVSYSALLEDAKDAAKAGAYFGDEDYVVGSLKASYAF